MVLSPTLTVAMVTKWPQKENNHFGANLRHLTEKFTYLEYKQTPKDILTDDENYHSTQHIKRFFWYLPVLISNS